MLRLKKALLVTAIALLCFTAIQLSSKSQALHIQNHSIRVSTAQVNATATHTIQFTYPSTDSVGSIVFQYCSNGALVVLSCTAPAGLNASGANLVSQSGNVGFSIDAADSSSNKIVLTRAATAGLSVASAYKFSNIVNPSTPQATTYVRISTYTTTDGSGPYNDDGGVAFATLSPFQVGANVPPFLKLCVGIVVSNNCSSVAGNTLDLGILNTSAARAGTSQFSGGTNSVTGFNVYTLGTTMTSGNNIIPAINPAKGSQAGISQFGLNLRANTNPGVGQNPQGAGTAAPQPGYNTPNVYKFQNGDIVVSSNIPTDFRKMTTSYVVNIDSGQPPGVYATTITYLGLAQF